MPLPISSWALEEKNKLNTGNAWLLALMITIPGVATPVRVVRNNEDVTWPTGSGTLWQAFPFDLNDVSENSKGEVPQVELKIANASRAIERFLQSYDAYVKRYGFDPIEVNIYVINSGNLSNPVPEVDYLFELKQPKTTAVWATFVLGVSNPFNRRFPKNRILKNHCRFKFNVPTMTVLGLSVEARTIGVTITNSYPGDPVFTATLTDSAAGFGSLLGGSSVIRVEGFLYPFNNGTFSDWTYVDDSTIKINGPEVLLMLAEAEGRLISLEIFDAAVNGTTGDECFYTFGSGGDFFTCDKKLASCRERLNTVRFGGFPGVGVGGTRLG